MDGSSESIQQTYAGMVTDIQAALWESSRLGEWIQGFSRTVRNTVNIIYVWFRVDIVWTWVSEH